MLTGATGAHSMFLQRLTASGYRTDGRRKTVFQQYRIKKNIWREPGKPGWRSVEFSMSYCCWACGHGSAHIRELHVVFSFQSYFIAFGRKDGDKTLRYEKKKNRKHRFGLYTAAIRNVEESLYSAKRGKVKNKSYAW